MVVRKVEHLSLDQPSARGKDARDRAPLSAHAEWAPAGDRADPVRLLEEQNTVRNSIAAFSQRYADQNERNYQAFTDVVDSGRMTALDGV
jgi:hypothetical protein